MSAPSDLLPSGCDDAPLDLDARVIAVPIRHHSPACARHLAALLEAVRPDAVLIECPADAEPLIGLMQQDDAIPPLALHASWPEAIADAAPIHHASYWPLAAFSPEWVALRTAGRLGIPARFIDLPYAAMVEAGRRGRRDRAHSLQDEHRLLGNRLVAAAARAAGVRDGDELWEHLFECPDDREPARFFGAVRAWCSAIRHCASDAELAVDGTLAREDFMAAAVANERGRIVVVTGGFHSPALTEAALARRPAATLPPPDHRATITLMRYGLRQLDLLNGYAAGMPGAGLCDRQWHGESLERTVVAFARELRAIRPDAGTADAIAAVEKARGLAALRGHARVGRADLVDAVTSAFVRGSADVEGVMVAAALAKFLAGDARGEVPAGAGTPPLVADFEATAKRLGLTLDAGAARELALDGHRRARHRETSRFLHRLTWLGVRFARRVRGPDYVARQGLDRIREVWRYGWEPDTESGLIEASRYGADLREAASAKLIEALGDAGDGDRRAAAAASLLLQAAVCGLHELLEPIAERVAVLVQGDPDFVSVVDATDHLLLVSTACEPLEVHDHPGIRALARRAWQRAALLFAEQRAWPDAMVDAAIPAIVGWTETAGLLDGEAGSSGESELASQVDDLLAATAARLDATPEIAGLARGLLHGRGRGDAETAARDLDRRLAGDPVLGSRYLRGLLAGDRAVLWQSDAPLASLDRVVTDSDEATFVALCPHLRLAFADLTPREIDRVAVSLAGRVAAAGGGAAPTAATLTAKLPLPPADVLAARDLDAEVRAALEADGLGPWLEAPR